MELDLLLAKLAKKRICLSHKTYYVKANKPDTLFALRLPTLDQTHRPICLKTSAMAYTSNPIKIVHKFHTPISTLYSPSDTFSKQADDLLTHVHLPTVILLQRACLNLPISTSEVMHAIKSINSNKHPGPERLQASYYKRLPGPPSR